MDFVKIAHVEDFEDTRIKSYTLLGKHVAVVKEADGSFYATEIGCKHQNADLTNGEFQGDVVKCPWHGWKYNIRTGQCVGHKGAPLRRHGLKLVGDEIRISLQPMEAQAAS